jgi:hypothetical protein
MILGTTAALGHHVLGAHALHLLLPRRRQQLETVASSLQPPTSWRRNRSARRRSTTTPSVLRYLPNGCAQLSGATSGTHRAQSPEASSSPASLKPLPRVRRELRASATRLDLCPRLAAKGNGAAPPQQPNPLEPGQLLLQSPPRRVAETIMPGAPLLLHPAAASPAGPHSPAHTRTRRTRPRHGCLRRFLARGSCTQSQLTSIRASFLRSSRPWCKNRSPSWRPPS